MRAYGEIAGILLLRGLALLVFLAPSPLFAIVVCDFLGVSPDMEGWRRAVAAVVILLSFGFMWIFWKGVDACFPETMHRIGRWLFDKPL